MKAKEILHDVHDLIRSVINGNEKLTDVYYNKFGYLVVETEDDNNTYTWEFSPDEE